MFRVSLFTTYVQGLLRFTLMAVELPHTRSRFIRGSICRLDTKVTIETRPLARAHAAVVYTRLYPVLAAVLPSNAYTIEQLAAMPMLPPQDYFARKVIASVSHANTHIAPTYRFHILMFPLRGGLAGGGLRNLSARDVRMFSRTARAIACEEIQQVELLWNADKTLAEIFRRQCGLGQSESQGWLFDFSIDFI